jgi:anti-sigma regulatory factor (Ser/Thr protein kinase)
MAGPEGTPVLVEEAPPSLAFIAGHEALPALSAWTDAVLERLALPARTDYALRLCIEEMVANLLLHALRPERPVQVRLTILAAPLRLLIEDDAAAFDPTAQPEPEPASDLDHAAIGGRGLPLVRRFSLGLRYTRDSGWNRVEIRLA